MALRSPEHGSGRSVLSVSSLAPWKVSVPGVLNLPHVPSTPYLHSSLPQASDLPQTSVYLHLWTPDLPQTCLVSAPPSDPVPLRDRLLSHYECSCLFFGLVSRSAPSFLGVPTSVLDCPSPSPSHPPLSQAYPSLTRTSLSPACPSCSSLFSAIAVST